MKTNNLILTKLLVMFLFVLISGCGAVKDTKQECISTAKSKDGSLIAYGAKGQGAPTIVFVHCWTCNQGFWNSQMDYFSQKYRVVRLDLAGHGASKSNRAKYTMSAFGEDVFAVVNDIKADNVILVGHSMGGPVVVEAAKLLGNKVIGIVGVDTFYTPFKYPKSEEEIQGFIKPFKDNFKSKSQELVHMMFTQQEDPVVMNSIASQMSGANPDMALSAMYEVFRWKANDAYSNLEPFSGKLCNINAAPTGKEVPLDKSVVLIPGAGHFLAQTKPVEFNQALDKIIAGFKTH